VVFIIDTAGLRRRDRLQIRCKVRILAHILAAKRNDYWWPARILLPCFISQSHFTSHSLVGLATAHEAILMTDTNLFRPNSGGGFSLHLSH
jgi:hypothetical protein